MNISPATFPEFSKLAGTLVGARPSSTTPPQSPGARMPAGLAEPKTMGALAVPTALRRPLLVTMSAPGRRAASRSPCTPTTVTPAAIVSVVRSEPAERTKIGRVKVYFGQLQVVFSLTSSKTTTPSPLGSPQSPSGVPPMPPMPPSSPASPPSPAPPLPALPPLGAPLVPPCAPDPPVPAPPPPEPPVGKAPLAPLAPPEPDAPPVCSWAVLGSSPLQAPAIAIAGPMVTKYLPSFAVTLVRIVIPCD